MELLAIVQCTVYADDDVVLWNSTFSTFYSTCPLCSLSTSVSICLCLHLCITVIYLSISLEVSVSVFLSMLFSFLLIFHLTHPSFLSLWISLTCSLSPGFFFQLSLLFQLGERLGQLLIHCFISEKQCDHGQLTNLLHFKFLPCKRELGIPLLPPSLSFYEKDAVGWQQQC